MKLNKLNTLAITAVLTGSLLAGGTAIAGEKGKWQRGGGWGDHEMHEGMKHGGPFKHIMRTLRGLDLTAEQKKSMIDIGEKYKSEFEAVRDEMRTARMALHEAMTPGEYGSSDAVIAATEPAAEAQAQAMKNLIILRAQVQSEMHNLLTPEQLEQLQERREKMLERRQQKWEKRQQG